MAKWKDDLAGVAAVAAALSDPGRLRLLMAMETQRMCVCQLTELLGLAPSTVSKHLSILKQAGLVREDKSGRWVFHQMAADSQRCCGIVAWLNEQLSHDATLAADRLKLKQILKTDPEELCRKQSAK